MKKFERESDNRIIAGVCGGLSRYFGVNSKLVRVLFTLLFLFGPGFLIYILLWMLIPVRHTSREKLSRDLRRKARNLDRLLDVAMNRISLPELEDRLQRIQEMIETLLPDFEPRSLDKNPDLKPLAEAALVHLPRLLEEFVSLPIDYAQRRTIEGALTAQDQLSNELARLEDTLSRALKQRFGQKFNETANVFENLQSQYEDDPTAPFRHELEKLQAKAANRLDDEAKAKIEKIKSSLLAVLSRLQTTTDETDPNLYNVRQIALEYLPNTVEQFINLPPTLVAAETLAQGKSPKAILHEQLDVLDGTLSKMLNSLYQKDTQGLMAHGHFLRDKFLDGEKEWMGR